MTVAVACRAQLCQGCPGKAGQFGESVPCIIMMLNAEIVQRKKLNPFCPVAVNSEQVDS
jgi:hypothetical protein